MTATPDPRTGLIEYTSGTDPHPGRVAHNQERQLLSDIMVMGQQGLLSARPAAGKDMRLYWATDVGAKRLYWDDGTSWNDISTNGGGGAGSAIVPGAAAAEGSSGRSARADHTHSLPLVTTTVHGAMRFEDKAKLDAATASPTASTLLWRDSAGRTQVAAPVAAADVATKEYVDAIGTQAAAGIHTHTAADIVSGTIDPARLPFATSTVRGAMLAVDKVKLDASTSAATASTIVMRDASGRAAFADPSAVGDAATKNYVDTNLAGKANTTHTHSWSQIVSGVPTTFTPSAHTHAATDMVSGLVPVARLPLADGTNAGAMTSADKVKLDGATELATVNKLMKRDATGRAQIVDPFSNADIANKGYVLSQTDTKSPIGHTHDWDDVTGTPAAFPTTWTTVSGKPSTFAPTLGFTSTTAKPGNWAPTWSDIQDKPVLVSLGYADANYATIESVNAKINVSVMNTRMGFGSTFTQVKSPDQGTVFQLNDAGTIGSTNIYNTNAAVGSFRSLWVNSGGVLGYNLSSRKYKVNERRYSVPLNLLKEVSPAWFKLRSDVAELGEAAPERVNFIAEDLYDAGLHEFVDFQDDVHDRAHVETTREQLMVTALWSFCQQLLERIEDLEN